jgi:hypothetical protein
MKLEEALTHLRLGSKIFLESSPDRGHLRWSPEHDMPLGSFYITVFDVLSEDWKVEEETNSKE